MPRQRLGVACDLTRINGAAGEMGRALQKKTKMSSMLSKLFLLLVLQPQNHGYKPHAVRLAHIERLRRPHLLDAIVTHPLVPIVEEEAHPFARSVFDPENRFATATCGFPIIPVCVETFPILGDGGGWQRLGTGEGANLDFAQTP